MSQTPFFKSGNLSFDLFQTRLKAELDPITAIPFLNGLQVSANLTPGVNVINHLLQRKQQGWWATDTNGSASFYRSAAFNDTTLTLTSNGVVTVGLWVF